MPEKGLTRRGSVGCGEGTAVKDTRFLEHEDFLQSQQEEVRGVRPGGSGRGAGERPGDGGAARRTKTWAEKGPSPFPTKSGFSRK